MTLTGICSENGRPVCPVDGVGPVADWAPLGPSRGPQLAIQIFYNCFADLTELRFSDMLLNQGGPDHPLRD